MDDHNNTDRVKDEPAAGQLPEPADQAEKTADDGKKENENEPKIEIRQVPMDGICGGY